MKVWALTVGKNIRYSHSNSVCRRCNGYVPGCVCFKRNIYQSANIFLILYVFLSLPDEAATLHEEDLPVHVDSDDDMHSVSKTVMYVILSFCRDALFIRPFLVNCLQVSCCCCKYFELCA